jgi:type I restriction enzyme R subunit
MPFEFFDRKTEHVVRHGNLPHWYQPGVTYFVTFRTADSVPQALLRSWHARREAWLRQHGLDPRVDGWNAALRAMPDAEQEYHRTFTRSFMEYLDRGEGECPLKNPELARIVAENLRYGNGTRYHLGDFVVMPNHVHLLACLISETQIEAQCRSWKHYTATAIHRVLNRKGRFWQSESFDHLVRSPEQFAYLQDYIATNPANAGLRPGSYLLESNKHTPCAVTEVNKTGD